MIFCLFSLLVGPAPAEDTPRPCSGAIEVDSVGALFDRLQDGGGEIITYEGSEHEVTLWLLHPSERVSAQEVARGVVERCVGCGLIATRDGAYAHVREPGSMAERLMDTELDLVPGVRRLSDVVAEILAAWSEAFPGEPLSLAPVAYPGAQVRVPEGPLQTRQLLRALQVLHPNGGTHRIVWKIFERGGRFGGVVRVISAERDIPPWSAEEALEGIDAHLRSLRHLAQLPEEQEGELLGVRAEAAAMVDSLLAKREALLRECPHLR